MAHNQFAQGPEPGPIDLSILVKQGIHRSKAVWDNPNMAPLKICKVDRIFWKSGASHDNRIMERLRHAGFYGVAKVDSEIILDWGLIQALVERWRPETHTFHLPVGEMTITLQDVEVLWGLKVDGDAVIRAPLCMSEQEWSDYVYRLLGLRLTRTHLAGSSFSITPLAQAPQLNENSSAEEIDQVARIRILQLMGGSLFTNTDNGRVNLQMLSFLEDFDDCGRYSWGSAVLAWLYRCLCRASDATSKIICGALVLLQVWAWERLLPLRPLGLVEVKFPQRLVDAPLMAKWGTPRSIKNSTANRLCICRDQLDYLQPEQVIWEPYGDLSMVPDYCKSGMHIWRSKVPLIYFYAVEWHLPERCFRQFGRLQRPPPHFDTDSGFQLHRLDGRGRASENWLAKLHNFVSLWDNRAETVQDETLSNVPLAFHDPYMQWYRRITRSLVGNPKHRPQQGYQPLGATLEHSVRALHYIHEMARQAQRDPSCYSLPELMQDVQGVLSVVNRYPQRIEAEPDYIFYSGSSNTVLESSYASTSSNQQIGMLEDHQIMSSSESSFHGDVDRSESQIQKYDPVPPERRDALSRATRFFKRKTSSKNSKCPPCDTESHVGDIS